MLENNTNHINIEEIEEDKTIKGLSFEMEFEIDEENEHYVATSIHFVSDLLQKWILSRAVEGVVANNKSVMVEGFNNVQAWALPPKIVQRKKYILAEIITKIKTTETAYSLYLKEQEYCTKYNIHVSSKNTIMEYTNRIGFLTGTYVRIASPKYYIADLTKRLNIREKIIDVKKEYTYEKGQRSKVLVIYATEEKADQINEQLSTIKSKQY